MEQAEAGFPGGRPTPSLPAEPVRAAEPVEAILAGWKRREEEERRRAAKRLSRIFARVRRDFPGRRHFVAGYHGAGDEGFLEYAGFVGTEGESAEASAWSPPEGLIPEFPPRVTAGEVEDLLAHFVPDGYDQSDGGQGVIRIDLETGDVEVAHEWNVTETQEDHRSYGLGAIAPAAARHKRGERPASRRGA